MIIKIDRLESIIKTKTNDFDINLNIYYISLGKNNQNKNEIGNKNGKNLN